MLVQMEGCDPSSSSRRVLLIGATNRPEVRGRRCCDLLQSSLAVCWLARHLLLHTVRNPSSNTRTYKHPIKP